MLMLRVNDATFFKASPVQASSLPANQKVSVNAGSSFHIKSYQKKDRHYFVRLAEGISFVGTSGFFFEEHIQIEEIRGVWLTNIDSNLLKPEQDLNNELKQLKNLGFNTIHPVVWNRGFTFYKSKVAQQVIGSEISPDFQRRDLLYEIIEAAKPHEFRVIPWFEYGLMTPSGSPLETKHPEWITHGISGTGEKIKDGNVWLNACHPDVQQFMADLIADVVQRYEIDGVQLDDHFGMPAEMGYDMNTLKLYNDETHGADPRKNPDSKHWKEWRTNKVTKLVEKIFNAVKAKKQDCIISISPNPLDFSRKKILADWAKWENDGLMEELVLQVYRDNVLVFENELDKPEVKKARNHIPTVIGILTGLKPNKKKDGRVPVNLIKDQVKETRERDFAGFSFFFFGSVDERFDLEEAGIKPEVVKARLQAFNNLLSINQFV